MVETVDVKQTSVNRVKVNKKKLRVLLVGEKYHKGSPSVTLSNALKRIGLNADFSEGIELLSTKQWLKKVRHYDVMIVVSYDGPDIFRLRQIALAAMTGIKVIRWWVGSDVLYCLEEPLTQHYAKLMQPICAQSIAVAAHLQNELKGIGIKASYIPSIVNFEKPVVDSSNKYFASKFLVYLPSSRKDFYGYITVKGLVEKFPYVGFIIVGDLDHNLADYSNVESLGWVDDIENLWPQVLCVVRITRHDGMPRMILEALKKEKYAIYSWELPGCHFATDLTSATKCMEDILASQATNAEGLDAYNSIMLPPPEERFANEIRKVTAKTSIWLWVQALWLALRLSLEMRQNNSQSI